MRSNIIITDVCAIERKNRAVESKKKNKMGQKIKHQKYNEKTKPKENVEQKMNFDVRCD